MATISEFKSLVRVLLTEHNARSLPEHAAQIDHIEYLIDAYATKYPGLIEARRSYQLRRLALDFIGDTASIAAEIAA